MTSCIRTLSLFLLILATGQRATADSSSVLSAAEAAKIQFSGAADWRPHAISLHPARWIWLPSQRTLPNTFVLFRKEIDLDSPPACAQGWIAADSRYRLTINGRYVLHQDVAGIRPTAPGFSRVQVRPQLGDLPDLELTSFTPKGAIHFQARKQGDGHQVRLTLPPGCEGELLTPAEARVDLTPLAPDRADGLKRYCLPAGRESAFWLPAGR